MYLEYPDFACDPIHVLTVKQWDDLRDKPRASVHYEYIEVGVDPQFPDVEAVYAFVDRENERRRRLSA